MSWDAMVEHEQRLNQLREDHGLVQAEAETRRVKAHHHSYGVSYRQGYRHAWWDAVLWVLDQQMRIDDLTAPELIAELRKGPTSIYWPVKAADPRFWGDCDHCRTMVIIDAEGICPLCGEDLT